MIKIILFLSLSSPIISFAQLRDSVHIKTDIYEIVYSEVLQQPKWVKYVVLCPNGTASRKGMFFYTSPDIKTSDDNDYIKNIFDKGHMAPAADFNCNKEMLHKTFSYVNCALQNQILNRTTWKYLESYERELAKLDTVSVYIKVFFSNIVLRTGATVPSGFYKEIRTSKHRYCYYFKNEKPLSLYYTKYKCNCN